MTYRQCLWDPVKVSITKHSPSLRQYARSLSLHGLKCSDRSVEYVVVSAEETRKGKKCCEDKYWMFLQHTLNKFDHTGLSNIEHRLKEMESTGHANLRVTAALSAIRFLKRFTRNTCRKTNQPAAKLEYNLSYFRFPKFPFSNEMTSTLYPLTGTVFSY